MQLQKEVQDDGMGVGGQVGKTHSWTISFKREAKTDFRKKILN